MGRVKKCTAVVWYLWNGAVSDDHVEAPFIRWNVHPGGQVTVRGVDEDGKILWGTVYFQPSKIELVVHDQ